jgi:DNA-binding response OmpR family regulator
MPGLIQRFFASSPNPAIPEIHANKSRQPRVLAVTADLCFYSGVLSAASSARWRTDWARTLNRAVEMCRSKSPPIVIYDSNLPGVDWRSAFDRLSAVPSHPRILLAAPSIDEELWENVLRRHGYDVVERAANSEQLERVFRFAWLSLPTPARTARA